MLRVAVCVGSACHLKGSADVIRILQDLIATYGLEDQVYLEGSFCQEQCTKGVVVRIGDELVTGVQRDGVFQLFQEKILRRCRP
ncbi:MAG TPA: (2Fe-2S) ferredoxin domain-containing protein [Firmicutes bacterium]|jgi:NADH:ubiquinone oxidoreductase subunit E|nr:(2Fe-2S) ferredoxin domain-containing protein [Bacillota bacterium]